MAEENAIGCFASLLLHRLTWCVKNLMRFSSQLTSQSISDANHANGKISMRELDRHKNVTTRMQIDNSPSLDGSMVHLTFRMINDGHFAALTLDKLVRKYF
jgi:hypothetical protein